MAKRRVPEQAPWAQAPLPRFAALQHDLKVDVVVVGGNSVRHIYRPSYTANFIRCPRRIEHERDATLCRIWPISACAANLYFRHYIGGTKVCRSPFIGIRDARLRQAVNC
jgi:hypothetical protein